MEHTTDMVAGERLEELQAALDLFEFAIDDCGNPVMTALLPPHLSQCLTRALKTIAAQMAAGIDSDTFFDRRPDPIQELLRRIGQAESGCN
jgi:hypothetical protein